MLNYNEIKELIDIIDKSSLRCFELEGQDIKIKMNKNLEFSQNFEDEIVVKNVENRKSNNEVSKTELSNSTVSNKVKEEVKNEANEEDGNFKIVKSINPKYNGVWESPFDTDISDQLRELNKIYS